MGNGSSATLEIEFLDNKLLPLLFGDRDEFLAKIEAAFNVVIQVRGNHLNMTGRPQDTVQAQKILTRFYERLQKGQTITAADVDGALRMALGVPAESMGEMDTLEVVIPTRRRVVGPRTPGQANYIHALQNHDLVLAIGPAGTGKTYLAVATAVSALLSGLVARIILSRPAVEAGEHLGFLPGDLREKVDPYLRPLYDALHDMLPSEQVNKRLANGEIEIAPLAFMRGRTLERAYVILDEAQNATPTQMKMFLTRLGENSKMVVTGDLSQVDLPSGVPSGLRDAAAKLGDVEGVKLVYFTDQDVVRHPLVGRIIKAYGPPKGAPAVDQ